MKKHSLSPLPLHCSRPLLTQAMSLLAVLCIASPAPQCQVKSQSHKPVSLCTKSCAMKGFL